MENEIEQNLRVHIGGKSNPDAIELLPRAKPNDTCTLRVRGGDPNDADLKRRPTDPSGLSRSVLHVLSQHEYVKIESVGPIAMNVVMAAFRMACEVAESRDSGVVLVMRQSKYTAEIGGKRAEGIRSRVFAIPIKYAV